MFALYHTKKALTWILCFSLYFSPLAQAQIHSKDEYPESSKDESLKIYIWAITKDSERLKIYTSSLDDVVEKNKVYTFSINEIEDGQKVYTTSFLEENWGPQPLVSSADPDLQKQRIYTFSVANREEGPRILAMRRPFGSRIFSPFKVLEGAFSRSKIFVDNGETDTEFVETTDDEGAVIVVAGEGELVSTDDDKTEPTDEEQTALDSSKDREVTSVTMKKAASLFCDFIIRMKVECGRKIGDLLA